MGRVGFEILCRRVPILDRLGFYLISDVLPLGRLVVWQQQSYLIDRATFVGKLGRVADLHSDSRCVSGLNADLCEQNLVRILRDGEHRCQLRSVAFRIIRDLTSEANIQDC